MWSREMLDFSNCIEWSQTRSTRPSPSYTVIKSIWLLIMSLKEAKKNRMHRDNTAFIWNIKLWLDKLSLCVHLLYYTGNNSLRQNMPETRAGKTSRHRNTKTDTLWQKPRGWTITARKQLLSQWQGELQQASEYSSNTERHCYLAKCHWGGGKLRYSAMVD